MNLRHHLGTPAHDKEQVSDFGAEQQCAAWALWHRSRYGRILPALAGIDGRQVTCNHAPIGVLQHVQCPMCLGVARQHADLVDQAIGAVLAISIERTAHVLLYRFMQHLGYFAGGRGEYHRQERRGRDREKQGTDDGNARGRRAPVVSEAHASCTQRAEWCGSTLDRRACRSSLAIG